MGEFVDLGEQAQAVGEKNAGDPLNLESLDDLGMVLVTAPVVGSNFRSWSRAMRIALEVKQKLRLKKFWDKVDTVEVLPPCTCDVSKMIDH
ncbi:hypothetical protein GH714_009325 [Hevea brasiliensis]|uniref:Retrotransposon Copia-like N-terminal domain-containing protein n=1 Tax=Hevea brasiliensis TaxID=3981 RepID=A0A6A6K4W7_HEVBR|nr:hypothetical protein GH714_009340 [Hevea brasiliensis]KAF2296857.1 hypothetical protein GH714_009325 [Hevea brasiliensis]